MKVITEKGGVKASSVNDRSIEHSISQKTELSKKNEKALSGKTERTVRRSEKDEPVLRDRGNPVQTERRQFAERKEQASGKAADRKIPLSKSETSVGSPKTEIKTSCSSEKINPIPFRPPKQYKLSPHQPKNKKYKVLKNGTVANGTLTKRKERVIYSQQQNKKLRKIKRKKIDKSRLKLLKSFNRQQKKIFRKKAELISIAMGGVTPAKVGTATAHNVSAYIKSCYAANIYLNGTNNGGIAGADGNENGHKVLYCIVDNANNYPVIGKRTRSSAKTMILSVPADTGLTVEGVLSVLNAKSSGYGYWERSDSVNGGYPYPCRIFAERN